MSLNHTLAASVRFSRTKLLEVLAVGIILFFSVSNLSAEVLVYKWKITGSEYYSSNGDPENRVLRKLGQYGFLAVGYTQAGETYSDPKIVRYWTDAGDKTKYYFEEDFLYGIAAFEKFEVTKKDKTTSYLSISAFWGGMLGEYYSGIIKTITAKSTGGSQDLDISSSLKGWSSWDKTFTDASTSQGGGIVQLTFDSAWTKYANENHLTVDDTVTDILSEVKKKGYDHQGLAAVINTPAASEVAIEGGTIDGTVIGSKNPKNGTFLNLQTGDGNVNGNLIFHSGDTGFNAALQPSPSMTEDTVMILPPSKGSAGQVLTTDGTGVLSWTSKSSGTDISILNAGTRGEGVFDSKSGPVGPKGVSIKTDYLFRNVAPGSDKIIVGLTNKNIEIDVDESKINPALLSVNALDRANQTGTQTSSTISDFQEAVLANPNVFFSNTTAVVAPSVNDDSSKGFSAGSVWVDTLAKIVYLCADATPGVAVWKETSQPASDYLKASNNLSDLTDKAVARDNLGIGNIQNIKSKYDGNAPPTVNDDANSGYLAGSTWLDITGNRIYICLDSSPGAALWQLVTAGLSASAPSTGGGYTNSNISGWD